MISRGVTLENFAHLRPRKVSSFTGSMRDELLNSTLNILSIEHPSGAALDGSIPCVFQASAPRTGTVAGSILSKSEKGACGRGFTNKQI